MVIYTYKNPEVLLHEIRTNGVHKAEELKIYAFEEKFIAALEKQLGKNNRWSLIFQQNQIALSVGDQSIVTELKEYKA